MALHGPASEPQREKKGTLSRFLTSIVAKHQKFGGEDSLGLWGLFFHKKVSQCRKIEWWTIWNFSTSILSRNIKKSDPLGKHFIRKKVSQPFSLSRDCISRGKRKKTLWFSWLGQLKLSGNILVNSCRLKRKRVTVIVAFHFMKRRQKTRRNRTKRTKSLLTKSEFVFIFVVLLCDI